MNLDDLDLPSGLGKGYNPKKYVERELAEVDKTGYVNDWLSNVSTNNSNANNDNGSVVSITTNYALKKEIDTHKEFLYNASKMTHKLTQNTSDRQDSESNKSSKGHSSSNPKSSPKSNGSRTGSTQTSKKPDNSRLPQILNLYPAGYNFSQEGNQRMPNRSVNSSSSNRSSKKNSSNNISSIEDKTAHLPQVKETEPPNKVAQVAQVEKVWEESYKNNQNNAFSINSADNRIIQTQMKKAFGLCTCKKCTADEPHDLVHLNEKFAEKKRPPQCRPAPLMKTKEVLLTTVLTSPVGSDLCNYSSVLVHGQIIPLPQTTINKTNLVAGIQMRFKTKGFENSKPVQVYGFPAIMRGNNVCLVHSHNTGKTITYVATLSSFLVDQDGRYDNITQSSRGPLVIVLANSSSVAEIVQERFLSMLENSKVARSVWMPILPLSQKEINARFAKNAPKIEVVITTVDTLLVLLNDKIIDLKRLCHFVVENIDIILDKFGAKFQRLLRAIDSMLSHRNGYDGVQFISTGERWTPKLEQIVAKLDNFPLICIGNPMQAALYGRADFQLRYVEQVKKPDVLVEVLSVNYSIFKCIIICKLNEISEIQKKFETKGIKFVVTSHDMPGERVVDLQKNWISTPNGKHIVLICTDKVLSSYVKFSNASFIVNYSLPHSYTMFSTRFSTMVQSYQCPLTSTFNQNKYYCKVVTFVDENRVVCLPKLTHFFTSNGIQVPEKLIQYCKELKQHEEQYKITDNIKLCKLVKMFGECKITTCKNRHLLAKSLDMSTNLPINGQIKAKLVNTQQINHYYVRILEYKDLEGKTHKLDDYAAQVDSLLQDCTGFEMSPTIETGQWYLYCIKSEVESEMYRCTVEKIEEYVKIGDKTTDDPSRVSIFGLDNGLKIVTDAVNLYTLPDVLKSIPQSVTELVVTQIIPPFNESMWTRNACRCLLQKLKAFNNEEAICTANILLRLNSIIWVDDLQIKERQGPFSKRFTLSKFLRHQQLLEQTDEPLQKLYKLCTEAGIDLPEYKIQQYDVSKRPVLKQAKAAWAHLSKEELNVVYFVSAASANGVYVKLAKFDSLLKRLEDAIETSVNLLRRKLHPEEIMIGFYYATVDEVSGDYCRVLLREIVDKDMGNCFYVDYGDSKTVPLANLKFLSNDLLTRLPFQAIECSLYGIHEKSGQSEKLVDALYDYGFEQNTDFFKTLYAMYMSEEKHNYGNIEVTNFKIILIDYYSGHATSVNSLLLEAGLAETVLSEALNQIDLPKLQDIPDVGIAQDDDDDNDDENKENEEAIERSLGILQAAKNDNSTKYVIDEDAFDYIPSGPADWSQNSQECKTTIQEPYMPIKAATATSDTLLPRITWYQNSSQVFLELSFTENNDYKVHITRNRFLNFNSMYKSNKYALNLNLFEKVRKQVVHESKTYFISVTLTKEKEEEWPRLAKADNKMFNIKYKMDKIDFEDSDDDDESIKVNRMKAEDIDPKVFDHIDVSPEGNVYEFYSDLDDSESDYNDDDENKF